MKNSTVNAMNVKAWVKENLTPKAVEEKLLLSGYEANAITEHVNEFIRLKKEKRQFTGFTLMVIGAFLGFVACVLTLFNPIPDLHDFFLFGVTMVAITLAIVGLYFVFE